jgi:hypothetical protein
MGGIDFELGTTLAREAWRYVVFWQGGLIFGLTIYAYYLYLKLWRRHGGTHPGSIAVIATAFILLTLIASIELALKVGHPLTWRAPLCFVAFSLGDLGLILILHQYYTRAHPPKP